MDNKKQCVSVRLRTSDLHKIKSIARRLQVRDSDVIRFAIKTTLARLMPLHDESVSGSRLLPVFIEHGPEINRHFDLDSSRLYGVINGDCYERDLEVDRGDVELLALTGTPGEYLRTRLREAAGDFDDDENLLEQIRSYLYEKYGKHARLSVSGHGGECLDGADC